jgi:hypothetical protein
LKCFDEFHVVPHDSVSVNRVPVDAAGQVGWGTVDLIMHPVVAQVAEHLGSGFGADVFYGFDERVGFIVVWGQVDCNQVGVQAGPAGARNVATRIHPPCGRQENPVFAHHRSVRFESFFGTPVYGFPVAAAVGPRKFHVYGGAVGLYVVVAFRGEPGFAPVRMVENRFMVPASHLVGSSHS